MLAFFNSYNSRDVFLVISIPLIILSILTFILVFGPTIQQKSSESINYALSEVHSNLNSNDRHQRRRHFKDLLKEHHDKQQQQQPISSSSLSSKQKDKQVINPSIRTLKPIPFEKCGSVREELHFEPYHHHHHQSRLHHHYHHQYYHFVTIVKNEEEAFSSALLFYSIYRTLSIAKRVVVVSSSPEAVSSRVRTMLSIFAEVVTMKLEHGASGIDIVKQLSTSNQENKNKNNNNKNHRYVLLDPHTVVYRNIDDLFDLPSGSATRIQSEKVSVIDSNLDNMMLMMNVVTTKNPQFDSSSSSGGISSSSFIDEYPHRSRIQRVDHGETDEVSSSTSVVISPWYLIKERSRSSMKKQTPHHLVEPIVDERIRAISFEDDSIFAFDDESIGRTLQEKYRPFLCFFDRTEHQVLSSAAIEGGRRKNTDDVHQNTAEAFLERIMYDDLELIRYSILQLMLRKSLEYAALNDKITKFPESWLTMYDSPKKFLVEIGEMIAKS